MTDLDPKAGPPLRKRRFRWRRAATVFVLLGSVIWLLAYLNSNAFRDVVRRRVVAELEQITGGRVELQSFDWKLFRLRFEARGLTIHGREESGQAPYLHADSIAGHARFSSFFSRQVDLSSLAVDHPVIHIIVYPDGSTNQPTPLLPEREQKNAVERLFDLAVDRLEITNGELLLNEQSIPFDLAGERLTAGMSYSKNDKSYDGTASLGSLDVRYRNFQPVRGSFDSHFLLRPSQAELKSLKFSTEHSSVEASVTIKTFNHPDVRATYSASLDMPELARIAGIKQLHAGHIDVNGNSAYDNGKYAAQGNVAGHNVAWEESEARISAVDFSSPFSVTPEKISLPHLSVRALGGSAQGELDLVDWNTPAKVKKPAPERGVVSLRLSNVQAAQAASAISSRHLPLDKLHMTGSISGNVNATWTGSPRNTVAELKLEVDPPANASAEQVPVTAHVQATWHQATRQIDVAALNAATRAMRLDATGALGSENTQLKVAFNAGSLRELQPFLATLSPGTRIPVEVSGRASFNGVVYGPLEDLSARGHFDMENFDTLLQFREEGQSVASRRPQRMHWDSFTGDIGYTPSNLTVQNGVLRRGPAQIAFSGSVGLNHGSFDENTSQLTAVLRIQNANVADIQPLAGIDAPITGILNADLHVTGSVRNLRGSGKLEATRLTLYGEPFAVFRSDINFAGAEAQLNRILLSHNGAQLTGSAGYRFLSRSFRFDLVGKNIELADFRRFESPRLTMQGKMEFHAAGSGNWQEPIINAQLDFHKLVLNGEEVGDIGAVAETHGPDMLLRARSNFANAVLTADGSMHLRDNFPGQITIKFEHLDFDPLIRAYFQGRITGHSSMEGYIDVHGPMKMPRDLAISANITQLSANIENVAVQNDGPLRFSMANQALRVDQAHFVGNATDMTLHGQMQIAPPYGLDLTGDGHMNLQLFRTFSGNVVSSGDSTFSIHLGGTVKQPDTRGYVDISNGAVAVVDLPNGLTQINGRLSLAQDRLVIEKLTAHTGGGELALGGFIAYRTGLYFDVTATSNDVRLRYPPGISASANASLHYRGSERNSQLSGTITVLRFAVDPHFDFAQYLERAKSPSTPTQNPFLDNLRLDVHVLSTPELRVETSLAKLSGDADLHIRGTVANPAVLGRVNIAEGNISFSGTKYRLERGDITFSNPQVIQPVINVEMSARVRGYDITIGFHGPIDKLSITYHSDPPLPSGDIIALLAFGRTREQDLYTNQTTQTLTTSDTVLTQALNSASGSRVQKLFGVGSVKIDPQYIGGAENNIGPRVTIEQQIQNNITLTYITNLAQSSSQQVIQVEYNVTRSVSIVAVRDQNGIVGFDVRIRKRKR